MTLKGIYKRFKSHKDCTTYLEILFWANNPKCPFCGYKKYNSIPKESRYRCKSCKSPFSVTVLTMFHKTKVDLQKWFYAIANDHFSCRQLAQEIEVTKDTANFMLNRIRIARKEKPEIIIQIKKEVYEQFN